MIELSENKIFELVKEKFVESKIKTEDFVDSANYMEITLDEDLLSSIKKLLKINKLYF